MVDKKTFTIGLLTVSAVFLLLLNVVMQLEPRALALESVQSRDYQLVTSRIKRGDDGVYILDNRSGMVALFTFEPQQRTLRVQDVRSMEDLMTGN